jgi:hypothetical protein
VRLDKSPIQNAGPISAPHPVSRSRWHMVAALIGTSNPFPWTVLIRAFWDVSAKSGQNPVHASYDAYSLPDS